MVQDSTISNAVKHYLYILSILVGGPSNSANINFLIDLIFNLNRQYFFNDLRFVSLEQYAYNIMTTMDYYSGVTYVKSHAGPTIST